MLSSLILRIVRDALPGNSAAQERMIGASLFAMGVADASCLFHCGAARRGCELTRRFCFAAHTINHQAESAFLATTELTYINSIIGTLVGLPEELRYEMGDWNAINDGNVDPGITPLTPVLS
jgi:hypothetical protein